MDRALLTTESNGLALLIPSPKRRASDYGLPDDTLHARFWNTDDLVVGRRQDFHPTILGKLMMR